MDLTQLANIGEFIGGLAVLGSLLYVGMQIRQNNRLESATTHRAILEEVSRYHRTVLEFPEVVQLGLSSFDRLEHRDKLIFAGFMQPQVTWFESVIHLHRRSLLDPVIFLAARNYVLSFILTPGGSRWWEESKVLYDPRVRECLEEAIEEGDDLPKPITSIPHYGVEGA